MNIEVFFWALGGIAAVIGWLWLSWHTAEFFEDVLGIPSILTWLLLSFGVPAAVIVSVASTYVK